MKKILFIVGSLREKSFNKQLALRAAALLEGAETSFLDYTAVPFMNQDLEYPVPEPVRQAREAVKEADAIWLVTPEYNHSYSGVLKNLIDWLSRPVDPLDRKTPCVLKEKKGVISGAAGSDAAIDARQNLVILAGRVGMEIIGGEGVGVALDKAAFASNELPENEKLDAELKELGELLMKSIS